MPPVELFLDEKPDAHGPPPHEDAAPRAGGAQAVGRGHSRGFLQCHKCCYQTPWEALLMDTSLVCSVMNLRGENRIGF